MNCVGCGKELSVCAKVCPDCGTYQDWTRHIFKWAALFGGITALAPLMIGAISLYKLTFKPEIDFRADIVSCAQEKIEVAIANRGRASLLLQELSIVGNQDIYLKRGENAEVIVNSGGVLSSFFQPFIGSNLTKLPHEACKYEYRLSVKVIGSTREERALNCDC